MIGKIVFNVPKWNMTWLNGVMKSTTHKPMDSNTLQNNKVPIDFRQRTFNTATNPLSYNFSQLLSIPLSYQILLLFALLHRSFSSLSSSCFLEPIAYWRRIHQSPKRFPEIAKVDKAKGQIYTTNQFLYLIDSFVWIWIGWTVFCCFVWVRDETYSPLCGLGFLHCR